MDKVYSVAPGTQVAFNKAKFRFLNINGGKAKFKADI